MGISNEAQALVRKALGDQRVHERYWSKVNTAHECWYWVGALHPKGHGRFWVGNIMAPAPHGPREVCVIAHRFGWALKHGAHSLEQVPVLAHQCDEASCQNPDHLRASSWADNLDEWQRRRWAPSSPLRDVRGPGGRARAIRAALTSGHELGPALALGKTIIDRDQLPLF